MLKQPWHSVDGAAAPRRQVRRGLARIQLARTRGAGGCEGAANCYVVKDAYGNNLGYSWPIEVMLGELEDARHVTTIVGQFVAVQPAHTEMGASCLLVIGS